MAMQKDIEFPSGVVATYHRILRASADFVSRPGYTILYVEVGCYLSKEAREAGKAPVTTEQRTIALQGNEPSRDTLYSVLSQPVRKKTINVPVGADPTTPQPITEAVEVDDPESITGFNGATLC
ncbi:MAG: hypothetical protein ACK54C_02105 [Betaproteobacteria bacterium]